MSKMTFAHEFEQLTPEKLIELALKRQEGVLASNSALSVQTGKRTGRSPKDRFIVKDDITTDTVDWGPINQPFAPEKFNELWARAYEYLSFKEVFISRLKVGADPEYDLPLRVITETAWHNLFATQLFIRDKNVDATRSDTWTIMSAPGFLTNPERDGTHSEAALIINFSLRRVLLCGLEYAGEIKKAMFSVLNFLLPEQDVLPMHCSANVGKKDDPALFFGLSGTGKTTLSADEQRPLVGDDEHGWSATGIFNFEGGCYAKCINLSEQHEPMIWHAISQGAVMENVVLDAKTKEPRYEDSSLSENTRAAYPREHISSRVLENLCGPPRIVIFLTCDLYGVLPPIALLNLEQTAYYFLSGYTAHVGSTEVGSSAEIKPTFSTCFGAPFFPRPAMVYANLLMKRITETQTPVYLINTGWTSGAYGAGGKRFDIPTTRAIVTAALSGELLDTPMEELPGFRILIPRQINGINDQLLNPRNAWANSVAYDQQANILIQQFISNFQKFAAPENIQAAGPQVIANVALV